jgi:hypothetical protein
MRTRIDSRGAATGKGSDPVAGTRHPAAVAPPPAAVPSPPHPRAVAAPRSTVSPPRRTVVAAPTPSEAEVLSPIAPHHRPPVRRSLAPGSDRPA